MKKSTKKGFTIVELVIVIAVIAILAAVLIPTFSSVTKSAKTSAAQQQAKAGLDSVLALTGGVLPDGTLFAITEDDMTDANAEVAADYWFAYTGNKLQQVELNKTSLGYPETYQGAEYAIYVSAELFGTPAAVPATASTLITNVGDLVLDVVNNHSVTTYTGFSIATGTGVGYFTGTLDGATDATVRVYYTSDIEPTQVIFVGN